MRCPDDAKPRPVVFGTWSLLSFPLPLFLDSYYYFYFTLVISVKFSVATMQPISTMPAPPPAYYVQPGTELLIVSPRKWTIYQAMVPVSGSSAIADAKMPISSNEVVEATLPLYSKGRAASFVVQGPGTLETSKDVVWIERIKGDRAPFYFLPHHMHDRKIKVVVKKKHHKNAETTFRIEFDANKGIPLPILVDANHTVMMQLPLTAGVGALTWRAEQNVAAGTKLTGPCTLFLPPHTVPKN